MILIEIGPFCDKTANSISTFNSECSPTVSTICQNNALCLILNDMFIKCEIIYLVSILKF